MALREYHWALAFTLAVMLHLAAYILIFGQPGAPQTFRGGGLFEQGGQKADSAAGVFVTLGQAGESAGEQPVEAEERVEAEPLQPEQSLAQGFVEGLEALGSDVEEAEPVEEPEPASEAVAEETVDLQAEEVGEAPESEAPPVEEAVEAKAPPIPARKPAPPPVQPELEVLEQRLSVQGPTPAQQPQPEQKKPEQKQQTAEAPPPGQPDQQAAATPAKTEEVLSFASQPSRLGNASNNAFGAVPNLNYEERVLVWLKQHGAYPREAYRFRQEGTVLLKFAVNRTGKILYYDLVKSSGYHLLDRAVKRMMDRSSPVPPIPPEINKDQIVFTVPVHFVRT